MLSLRLLSAIDWNAFFEQSSRVEAILRDDPSGVYPRQDFATRDRYRRTVETIARGSGADEIEVARRAIEWPAGLGSGPRGGGRGDGADAARATSGSTWSIAAGRSSRPRSATGPSLARAAASAAVLAHPASTYFGAIAACSPRSWRLAVRALGPARRPVRGG